MVKALLAALLMTSTVFAASNQSLVYQGQILRPDGTSLSSGTVTFTLSIYSPLPGKCLLYSETQSTNMTGSEGHFSLNLGTGARTDGGSHSFQKVFVNGGTLPGLTCASGAVSYSPGATDDRSLEVSFDDGGATISFSPLTLKSVAYALQAQEIAGYGVNDIVKIHPSLGSSTTFTSAEMTIAKTITGLTCANNEILKWTGSTWACSTDATGGTPADASYSAKGIVQFDSDPVTSGVSVTSGIAKLNFGTGANQVVKLDASGRLPAVDGSLLTNVSASGFAGTLGVANGGTGATTLNSNGVLLGNGTSAVSATAAGSAHTVLRVSSGGGAPAFGAIDLSQSAAVTGTLSPGNGGTGQSSLTAGDLVYATGATSTAKLGIGTTGTVLASSGSAPQWSSIGSLLNIGNGANQIVQLDGSAKLPPVDGSALTNLNLNGVSGGVLPITRGGTAAGSFAMNALVVSNSTGSALTTLTCLPSQIAKWNGASWGCVADDGFMQDSNANLKAGTSALAANVNGTHNIAIGQDSQRNMNPAGGTNFNVALGYESLRGSGIVANNTGIDNFAVGYQSLAELSSGSGNTAIGIQTLRNNTTGNYNIGIGTYSLLYNTTGNGNLAFGWQALGSNETSSHNIAIGSEALLSNKISDINIAIGLRAQKNMQVNNGAEAGNIAIGRESMMGSATPTNNTGTWNVGIGDWALKNLTMGSLNVAIGNNPLQNTSTGSENIAIGDNPLQYNTSGYKNIALGSEALQSNTTGANNVSIGAASQELMKSSAGYNTALGDTALRGSTTVSSNTGSANTAIGAGSLYELSSGNFNTAIGKDAGYAGSAVNTGSNNTFIGASTGLGSATQRSNATAIGSGARVDASDTIVLGRAANDRVVIGATGTTNTTYKFHVTTDATRTGIGGNAAWSNSSDARYKTNVEPIQNALGIIQRLQGVRFDWDHEKFPNQFEKRRQIGFLAQQIEPHVPEIVKSEPNGYKAVQYSQLVAVLTEALKELHQKFLNEKTAMKAAHQTLENELKAMQSENAELARRLEILEQKINSK